MTIDEVFYFSQEIDFSGKLDSNEFEKNKTSWKSIVEEFEDTNLSRMLHTLNILDDIEMSYLTILDDIDYRAERVQSLKSNVSNLKSFKQLVDTKT